MNAVAPPFLVMLYFSDDSSNFSGSDCEIRCKQCEWDIQQRSCLVCHKADGFPCECTTGVIRAGSKWGYPRVPGEMDWNYMGNRCD